MKVKGIEKFELYHNLKLIELVHINANDTKEVEMLRNLYKRSELHDLEHSQAREFNHHYKFLHTVVDQTRRARCTTCGDAEELYPFHIIKVIEELDSKYKHGEYNIPIDLEILDKYYE